MKKIILSFLLMFCLAFSFSSCKKDDTTEKENTQTPSVSEDIKEEKPSKEKEISDTKQEEKKESSSKEEEKVSPQDFENLVETFNSTDDEKEKEEARKKIEEILKQVEAQQK
jgi:hypothetical protein